MAIGGGDENTRINITAVPKGFAQTTAQLEALIKLLASATSKMAQSGNVQGLKDLTAALNQAQQAAAKLSAQQGNQSRAQAVAVSQMQKLKDATAQATAVQNEFNKQREYGVKADQNTKAGRAKVDAWQQSMGKYNMALIGKPENMSGLVNNLRAAKEGLKDVRIAGIATQESIKALNNPGSGTAFGVPLSGAQQFSAMLQITRKNVDSLFGQWRDQVSKMTMQGRQMIQGITLPLAGVALSAVNAWASVEKEILSIKKVTDFKGIGDDVDYSNVRKEIRATSREYAISEKGSAHAYQEIVQLGVRGAENISGYMKNVMDLSLIGNMDTDSAFQFFRTLKALEADAPGRSMGASLAIAREEMAKMNAIADNTSVKLQDLAQAFPEVAPVMQQMGFSASAVGASLAGMYKRGIPATEAAHGLKFALQRLVAPTKKSGEVIKQLGFSFFDANGEMSDASGKMFDLADQFSRMDDKTRALVAPELFGSRQSARMNSYFNDVAAGGKELEKLAAGQIKWEDLTSDFLKGLIATGEIKLPGIDLKEVENSAKRYDHAVEMFKKDPLKAFERLKVTFKQIYTQLGATLAPTIISVGEKFVGFLEGLQNAPPLIQKIAIAIASIAVALGPLKYITAQLAATGITLAKTALHMAAPAMVNVMPSQAGAALAARSSGNFMYLGEKTMLNPKAGPIDRLRGRLGFSDKVSGKSRGGLAMAAQSAQKKELLATIEAEIQLNKQLAASHIIVASNTATATVAERQLELERLRTIAADEALIAEEARLATMRNASAASATRRGPIALMGAAGKKTGSLVAGAARATGRTAGKAVGASAISAGATNAMATSGKSLIPVFGQLAAKAGLWGLALAAIVVVIIAVVMVVKNIKGAWESFMKAVKPGIDAIKRGFGAIKDAFSSIFGMFGKVLGQLGGAGTGAAAVGDVFSGVGGIVSAVATGIGIAMEWIANAIKFAMPFFERIAYTAKDVIGFIGALFQGDWKNALLFFVAALYETVRPVVIIFDIILKAAAQFLSTLLDMVSRVTKWVPWLGDQVNSAKQALESFSDTGMVPALDNNLRGLGGIFSGGVTKGAKDAKGAATDAGEDLGENIGDGINMGVGDSGGTSWVKSWIDKVIGRIDKEMDRVRKSATAALKKAHEAALKVYDDRIKAIDDQEKAEEKLFRTEDYLSKKRELLAKRNLDKQNYQNERAIAVYEGRYNDVRMLDLQEQANKKSYADDLGGIESDRVKELLKDSRDAAKEQINIEKESTQRRLEIESDYFEQWMALITEYTPLTVGEFQNMTDQINRLLINAGASWPEHATTAMERFSDIFANANRDVVDEFRKSGNDAVTAWMESFIGSEELKILKDLASKNGGGGDSKPGGGSTDTRTPAEIEADFFASLPSKSSQATPDQLASWVGSGQGMGGPAESGSGGVSTVEATTQNAMRDMQAGLINGLDVLYEKDVWAEAVRRVAEMAAASWGNQSGGVLPPSIPTRPTGPPPIPEDPNTLAGMEAAAIAEKAAEDYAAMVKRITAINAKNYREMNEKWKDTTIDAANTSSRYSKDAGETAIFYNDRQGARFTEIGGEMIDQSGRTVKALKNDSGEVYAVINADNQKIFISSKTTYESAADVFQAMLDKGLKPGQAEAQIYVDKINALGGAVATVNGKQVLIEIKIDDWQWLSSVANINKWLSTLSRKQQIIAAAGFSGRSVYFKNVDGVEYSSGDQITWVPVATGGMFDAATNSIKKFAYGGLVKQQTNGILANIGEGGYDEFVISTDPKYRAQSIGYLSAAASRLGVGMASRAAAKAASSSASISYGGSNASEYAGGGSGDVYISVDTFIGEEQWFAELAGKYNMKTVPRQRKLEGQQKRVVSSYNDRYRLR